MNDKGRVRAAYTSPRAKVVEMKVQGAILTESGDRYGLDTGDEKDVF